MVHKIQIDDVVRNATAEEIKAIEARHAEVVAKAEEEAVKAEAKAELLKRLGITAEEAQLLLP